MITSKNGAVINDFLSNIGKFGYKLTFIDSRVEGQAAVKDLLLALKSLRKHDLDVLVIMRGGGSLESFMAFNNEMLVREIRKFPVPVITGVGHDNDVPLVVLAADQNVSTPTAVANLLNKTWKQVRGEVKIAEHSLVRAYENVLNDEKFFVERAAVVIKVKFGLIFEEFRKIEQQFGMVLFKIENAIGNIRRVSRELVQGAITSFTRGIAEVYDLLKTTEKELAIHNPLRQLKLGYSITRFKGAVLKSVQELKVGDSIEVTVGDGSIGSGVTQINN